MQSRTVILYGQSMLLSLMAVSLSQNLHLCVQQTDLWEKVVSLAAEYSVDVLIFDLASASEGRILTLLYNKPSMQLIGLDVETNRAILLTGHAIDSLTLERVKEIVHGII